jgi:cellulose synthase/poly-beta-1,6-N-acetylglucosamine synthase-like glycosyltransferase
MEQQDFIPAARLGKMLLEEGLLLPAQLDEALRLQHQWGSRLGDIVLAKGWVRALDFYRVLARHYGKPHVNLLTAPPDASLINQDDLSHYGELLILPWRRIGGVIQIASADPSIEAIAFARQRFGDHIEFVITSKFDIIWQLQHNSDVYMSHNAVNMLLDMDPEYSAKQVFSGIQIVLLGVAATITMILLTIWPVVTLIALNIGITAFLLVNFGLRALLAWVGANRSNDIKVTDHQVAILDDRDLPVYTVLVPMYKEPEVLPELVAALRRLDYPLSKLDIKLILEQDDVETVTAAQALGLEGIFEIIRVPDSQPKTKPKACNYALHFARGDFTTIYDAEDQPEPDQLKKAIIAFRKSSEDTVCIQARLNYFNASENWLTRMFTLEYSLWFDFYLPALEALNIPIPLGGTSNHFKTRILRKVHAWDPFNVTEDADLGLRIAQIGAKVGVVNSTTFEEANSQLGNWIRQRSRWIKGYMQTYLVHMRNPVKLYQRNGTMGFWGFQFFVGGAVFSLLLTPFMYAMYLFWLVTRSQLLDTLFPPTILYISMINLLIGNGYLIYLAMVGTFKRKLFALIPYALTMPVYWLLMSVAAYKGLWQLIYKPFFWEKTRHGISKFHVKADQPAQKKNA